MSNEALVKSILSELAYFDVFEYPLTPMEIWRYSQSSETKLEDVLEVLDSDPALRDKVDTKWGFYFLKDREHTVELRLKRYRESESKYQKVKKFARRLSAFPFVKMIAVCNSLAYSNSRNNSDIDLFIVAEPGRIWTARFYVTAYLKLLNERPTEKETKDKICVSFFVTSEQLNLSSMRDIEPDIYLAHWVKQIVPVYDPENIYSQFLQANRWVEDMYPQCYPMNTSPMRRILTNGGLRSLQKFYEFFHQSSLGNQLEKKYKKLQQSKLPTNLREMVNQDTRVVMTDTMLKFHDKDRRAQYQDDWMQKIRALGI
ncbi:hypothetical protein KKG41_06435 [Patescibacteria group bacterium]|nr:hypothetical protein [Patescibacteria group bacterium]MBU1890222.1 hypothetical protein [Patescibacteria group bacterium]